jgi:Predicted membrane protein (DUF2232)
MTALTYVLGAPSLKVLRRQVGRSVYWSSMVLLSAGLFLVRGDSLRGVDLRPLAVAFFSLVLLIGLFEEFEEMGLSLKVSAFFALVINALISAGAFAFWVFVTGPRWNQIVLSTLENILKPLTDLNPHLQISYADLMMQLPSIAVILWMFALYVAVLLEGRLGQTPLLRHGDAGALRSQLATLQLPDSCVWVFIVSLLGAFIDFGIHPLEVLSVNAMNICLVLFFFQGVAVVAKFFESLRMGVFWQTMFMILIVLQLFLFVSLLGLLDFWLGFRPRLAKRMGTSKSEI